MTIQYQGVWSLQSAAQLQSTQRWVTDPLYRNTTLLLQADDAANAAQNNTFLDSSSNSFAITRNPASGPNAPTQGTFTPFSLQPGAWSNFFDGTGDYLSNTSTALITNTVSTFTVESWVYFTATPPANGNFISSFCTLDGQPTGPTNFLSFGPLNDGKLYLFWFDGSVKYASGNTVLALNTWYHIACVVNSNSIQFYVNGIPEVMGNTTTLTNRSGSQGNFAVASSSGGQITGYISNFRVTTTAVYTSRFTPSTTPLTPVTGTVLLTCQSNQFIDTNTQVAAKALTVNGNSAVQAFSPFAPQFQWTPSVIGGSGYFDGTGDYLETPNNATLALGSSDFSVEWWEYRTTLAAEDTAIGASGTYGFYFNYYDAGFPRFFLSTSSGSWNVFNNAPTGAISANAWNHFVVTRSGTAFRVFLNGILSIYATGSGSVVQPNNNFYISGNAAQSNFPGYISNVRVVRGSIPTSYQTSSTTTNTSIFTSPTAPLTTTSQGATSGDVRLLLNFTNAGIVDATMKNNLETVGNAQISTAVVKYGSGSLAFDGTGDYLSCPAANAGMNPQSGDFTIECWVWIPSLPGAEQAVVSTMTTGGSGILFGLAGGGNVNKFQVGIGNLSVGNPTVVDTTNFPVQTWTHMAGVRRGGVLYLYRNGVSVGTPTAATGTISQTTLTIGAWSTGGAAFNGYLDDVRITAGIARYTQNFIPPSVALPRQ